MFVSPFLKMTLEEELRHDSQQNGGTSTQEQEDQMPLQDVTAICDDIEVIEDVDPAIPEKEPLDKPTIFETEVRIKDGSVETELEKISIDNLDNPDDSKNKTFDRKCGMIAVLLLAMIVGGAIAAIFITKFSGKTTYTFKLANYFGDHMVLQRAPDRATIWGYGPVIKGNCTVFLTLQNEDESVKQEHSTITQNTVLGGIWKFMLDPVSVKGPFIIKVFIKEPQPRSIELKDVLFGDVWICAGERDMQNSANKVPNNKEKLEDFEQLSSIRFMSLMPSKANGPRPDVREIQLAWSKPKKELLFDEDTHGKTNFPGICWLYGRELHNKLLYPVGLVSATFIASSIEDWVTPKVIQECNVNVPYLTSMVYNALIHPLLSTSMYGVVWYQGELDASEQSRHYSCIMINLIKEWREKWYQTSGGATDPVFPFGIIQLAPNHGREKWTYGYTDIRWQQTANYGFIPNSQMKKTFMAVAVDLPASNWTYTSLYPKHQKEIAERLVRGALVEGYQRKGNIYQGPFPISYSAFQSNHSLVIYIDATEIDLRNNDGFEVCCANVSNVTCTSSLMEADYAPGRQWVSVPIISNGRNFIRLTWKDKEDCAGKFMVGLRYLWRGSPCEYLKCPIYDASSNLPMPPYIRNKMSDDGKLHIFGKTPTILM